MLKIVIADDNDLQRTSMDVVLEGHGYKVTQCREGRECLTVVRDWRPDLVITDLMMPGMEGLELIKELRREFPQLPIIAMSGMRHPVCLQAARLLGAACGLSKPFEMDDLLAAVAEVTKERRPGVSD